MGILKKHSHGLIEFHQSNKQEKSLHEILDYCSIELNILIRSAVESMQVQAMLYY